MSDPVIVVENLSKRYILGHQRATGDGLRHSIEAALRAPFAWLRSRRDRRAQQKEEFWALKDISFEVNRGEAVGIIGRNGAGKSTLLKILSRITEPTRGRIHLKGKVASLLEVGTGFHPELTGRENIFLNAAILGMKRIEIKRKFDEIVAFADIEKFLDTPVKRYSSGMYVRLAFAVAAHLEPEILVVDEVLAVGDAAFQKKCLGKMGDVVKEGRTVLFVSHNMGAISALTSRCLLLHSGRIILDGPVSESVAEYMSLSYDERAFWEASEINDNPMQILRIRVSDGNSAAGNEFDVRSETLIDIEYVVRTPVRNAVTAVNIHAEDGAHLISLEDIDQNADLLLGRQPGTYRTSVKLPGMWLNRGSYLLRVGCGMLGAKDWDNIERVSFTLIETGDHLTRTHRRGYLLPMLKWETRALKPCFENAAQKISGVSQA
jgi:lipopolysaccharide transport system ATP-binding protein